MKKKIDLAVAWDWEFDLEFIRLLKRFSELSHIHFQDITIYDVHDLVGELERGETVISVLLDRASDSNEAFLPLQKYAVQNSIILINPYLESIRTQNKAMIHYRLIDAGVRVPFTVMLPSFEEKRWIDEGLMSDIFKLKVPFVLKPAHGGGGEGVIKNVTSHHHVHDGRKPCYWDSYLAQEMVYPNYLYGWRCWFRVYWIFGEVEIAWWDDITLTYKPFSDADKPRVRFEEIKGMMQTIAQIAKLDFFSTEITLTRDQQLVAVDYINDQIDLRLKSKHFDGVPDQIVEKITQCIIDFAAKQKKMNNPT